MHNIHYREQFMSRGQSGVGAIAKASYRSGEKLYDQEAMRYKHIGSNAGLVAYSHIYLPEGVPERYADRETLWNEVMSLEKQKKAQYAHEWELALSNDLTLDECKSVIDEYVKGLTDQGMIVDANLHWKNGNHHIHLMSPTRGYDVENDCIERTKCHKEKVQKDGKIIENNVSNHPDWYSKKRLLERKKIWPEIQNKYLERDGRDLVTTESLEAQGIDREARPYLSRADYEAYKETKNLPAFAEPERPTYNKEDIEIRRQIDQIEELKKQIEELRAREIDPRDVALKTIPEEIKYIRRPEDGIEALTIDTWMRRYNSYMEKAERQDLQIHDRSEMRNYLEDEEIKNKFEKCRHHDLVQERALKETLPTEIYATKKQMEKEDMGPIVLETWRKKFNAYVRKAGREDLTEDSVYWFAIRHGGVDDLDPCEGNLALANRWAERMYKETGKTWAVTEIDKSDPRAINATKLVYPELFEKNEPYIPGKSTSVSSRSPVKPSTPVQSRPQIGEAIAAGIERVGARTGGKTASEQTIDDMTQGYSKILATLVRALSAVLREATKELRRTGKPATTPIKDLLIEKDTTRPTTAQKPIDMGMDARMEEAKKRALEKKKITKKIAKKVVKKRKISFDRER